METKNLYFKSDFQAILASEAGWTVPFRLSFYTNAPSRAFVASYDGTTYTNCHLESDGRLCIGFDNHGLGLGMLYIQPTFYLDNAHYQSGICDEAISPYPVVFVGTDNTQYNLQLSLQGATALQTIGTLPAYYQKGAKGDKGDKGADGTVSFSDLTAEQKASLRGPKGDTGSAGPQGIKGDKGADGIDGRNGTNGRDGSNGSTFTPAVSADGWLSWTNDGGKTNPESVNVKGPKGDTGARGPIGQAFTYNDFTEEQLAALKGPKGDTGATGAQGIQGIQGPEPLPTVETSIGTTVTDNYIYRITKSGTFTLPSAPTDNRLGILIVLTASGSLMLNTTNVAKWLGDEPQGSLESGKTYFITILDGVHSFYGPITENEED